ncbi:uncharacterized protein LOC115451871 [Manduca sexta]|uniref:uncharacterized protein LOC115451871 n=1 Tax=Manduca sexta TaxID=7130 RepID=UPI001183710B|nr:uncharacterized protein LOC115451871 [Manduca sexta]
MIIGYASIVLKLCSMGLMLAAGGLWATASVETRPKHWDEQTLVGGTIWSQVIIPLGLMISTIVDDSLDEFVHGYFLLSGLVLLTYTGTILVIDEYKAMQRRVQRQEQLPENPTPRPIIASYDRIYLGIGILTDLAAIFTLIDLMLLLIT